MRLIELRDIWKIYGKGQNKVLALKNINLTVEQGEFLSIVGKSGSGKSTLMNLLGCLDLPSRGQYWLSGEAVEGMSEQKRTILRREKIGFIFQGFHLIPGIVIFCIFRGLFQIWDHRLAVKKQPHTQR